MLRNSFVNLAVNVYSMSEPGEPKRTKSVAFDVVACGPITAKPEGFTRWDKLVIPVSAGVATPAGLVRFLKETQDLDVNMITSGRSILYNPMLFASHKATRGDTPFAKLVEDITKKPLGRKYVILDVSCYDDGGDVLIPQVQLYIVGAATAGAALAK